MKFIHRIQGFDFKNRHNMKLSAKTVGDLNRPVLEVWKHSVKTSFIGLT